MEDGKFKDGMENENYDNDDFEIFDENTLKELEQEIQQQLEILEEQVSLEDMDGGQDEEKKSTVNEPQQMNPKRTEKSEQHSIGGKGEEKESVSASGPNGAENAQSPGLQSIAPKIQALETTQMILDHPVTLQLLVMDCTCYVWCSLGAEGRKPMGGLHAALGTRFDPLPLVSTLVEPPDGNDSGASMAQRLSKKTGYMCFVSCNIDDSIDLLLPNVEKTVLGMIETLSQEYKLHKQITSFTA